MAVTEEFLAGTKVRASKLNQSGIPVVGATSDIATPFSDQTCLRGTDNTLYRYTGAAWRPAVALGGDTTGTRSAARYYRSTGTQTVTTGTDTKVQFPTADYESDLITAGGTNNDQFTINRDGQYDISCGLRGEAATNGWYMALSTGTVAAMLGNRFANSAPGLESANVSTTIRLLSGTVIIAVVFHTHGANRNITVMGSCTFFSIAWLRDI